MRNSSAETPVALAGEPAVDLDQARAHGLTDDEYRAVERWLGRTPTFTELGVFSVMWSEHCSYKSSRRHLRMMPNKGPRVVGGPGENAGALDVGDGWVAVFKIESHNHPSFVEPYQGAATGVGGILRDIFTMGARPVASMDSLKFGAFEHPRTRYLLGGVVGGIGGYGNCVGVPTVGGEVMFDAAYNGNILVNAFCLGLARRGELQSARAQGPGNPVMYVGSATGRDGIHGASLLASAEFDASSEAKRPTVQVGDPFTEKLLIEACLEAMQSGAIVAIQDMGAAGLTSSSSEMAARGELGIELDLDRIPLREAGLTPYEILLSESQERMLLVAERGREAELAAIFARWDLHAVVIGKITEDRRWRVRWRGKLVADIPAVALTDEAPVYDRPAREPSQPASDAERAPHATRLWAPPRRRSLAPTAGQSQRRLQAMGLSPVRLDGAEQHDGGAGQRRRRAPHQGNESRAGAEGRLQSARLRARPLRWRGGDRGRGGAQRGVRGRAADRAHQLSQLRQSRAPGDHVAVHPRRRGYPRRGARARDAGGQRQRELLQRDRRPRDSADADDRDGRGARGRRAARHPVFQAPGDAIILLRTAPATLAASEYAALFRGQRRVRSPPLDLERERALVEGLVAAADRGLIRSAHDVAEGGLAVTLAECCFNPDGVLGAEIDGIPEGA